MPTQPVTLTEITVFPLKSGQGIQPERWSVAPRGLRLDRRWMLIDGEHRPITQLRNPRLTRIRATPTSDGLTFAAPGQGSISCSVSFVEDARHGLDVALFDDPAVAVSLVGRELDRWFSEALHETCHLVVMPETSVRRVDQGALDDPVGFQNAYPIHLASRSSLDDLNERLDAPVPMDRFRPNLVIDGTEPHEDDTWRRIRIGETVLRIERACDHRCGIPNIDQQTTARAPEPLKTLATYRRSERGILFGQNAVVETPGEVAIGDPVTVLAAGDGYSDLLNR